MTTMNYHLRSMPSAQTHVEFYIDGMAVCISDLCQNYRYYGKCFHY